MKSWQRWGMRALALAMLLSLAAGPLMAGPRGGANDGDEYQDIIDSPNPDMLAGDPDDGGSLARRIGIGASSPLCWLATMNWALTGMRAPCPLLTVSDSRGTKSTVARGAEGAR